MNTCIEVIADKRIYIEFRCAMTVPVVFITPIHLDASPTSSPESGQAHRETFKVFNCMPYVPSEEIKGKL
jgi:hypothetical protein